MISCHSLPSSFLSLSRSYQWLPCYPSMYLQSQISPSVKDLNKYWIFSYTKEIFPNEIWLEFVLCLWEACYYFLCTQKSKTQLVASLCMISLDPFLSLLLSSYLFFWSWDHQCVLEDEPICNSSKFVIHKKC